MANPVFKQNNQGEILLFPPRLDENIEEQHLVRVINSIVDKMDLSHLFSTYKGGGTSSFCPRMLLKVLLYAYCLKIYTGRKIANALKYDITFMWLSGNQTPNFRTINNFRSGRLKESIEDIFKSVLEFMFQEGYIRFDEYYCDGTTLIADANKHKVIWRKYLEHYRQYIESRIESTIEEIDRLNELDDQTYGSNDLPIKGGKDPEYKNKIEEAAEKINSITNKKKLEKKAREEARLRKTMEMDTQRVESYKKKQDICKTRSGYSITDNDATPMPIKECREDLRPAYNAMIGSENQFITGVSVHQNSNDGTCFKDHCNQVLTLIPKKIKLIIADAIFGTEENYAFLEEENISGLLKYPSYDKEQEKKFKNNIFTKQNMPYDPISDSYECPNGRVLTYLGSGIKETTSGFRSTYKKYGCADCSDCPFYQECATTKEKRENKNHYFTISEDLERHKHNFRKKMQTKRGKALFGRRKHDVETCFGDIKRNQSFRRVHLRGLEKVKTEFTVVAIAHNLRKIQQSILRETKETA